ncbi:sulfatase family protein [Cyclobacterium jeungdonense]|uniref:Sulfatase n=1 Tax=Cyclobacterium jeungdonense TaxID=708087 RepID=A0ABT8CAY2_9BACT|nr:sulfatase [Cyclobacterium jeungdonense]MDN3689537.1 sulfatase [Cyclobacterium jeungdonense]
MKKHHLLIQPRLRKYSGNLLSLLFIVSFFLTSCQQEEATEKQPNILFIMTDDHTQQALNAYGQGLLDSVYFPNMDRLAKEGALFKNSFVTNSICAPSRAVLLTGKYSHLNGKVDNVGPFNWDQPTYPKLLQEAGYATALIGKIHLGGKPQGYDFSLTLPGQGNYYNPEFIRNGEEEVKFEGHCEALIPQFVVDWIDKEWDRSKPFAINYHTKAPHRNWMAEEKYLDYLEDQEFEFPGNFFDDYEGRGTAAREQEMEIVDNMYWGWDMKFEENPFSGEPSRLAAPFGRMTDEQMEAWNAVYGPANEKFKEELPEGRELARFMFHRYLRDYLKVVKSVDDGIGEVLDYLEANELLDNTIVVYTSDQGFYLGEHGWYDKRFMYEQSLSTPLLVRYPKEIKAGTVVEDLVMNLDHAPTILDYAGLEKPDDMQGESWRALAAGEEIPWRDAIYYHYYEYPGPHSVKRHYGVRTDRYKLIHFYYDIDEWEMYDLEVDPNEMNSIYDDPAYEEVQEMLHTRLEELREQYGDSDTLNQQFIERSLSKN